MKFMHAIVLLITSLCVLTTYPIIYEASKLTKKFDTGHEQTIWLLGDCHEYLSEIAEDDRDELRTLTIEQRNEIISSAKDLDATVLIEDMAVSSYTAHSITSLPTMITLAIDRFFKRYFHQVLTNLTSQCYEHGVKAESIECRHTVVILEDQPTYSSDIIRSLASATVIIGHITSGIFNSFSSTIGVLSKTAINLLEIFGNFLPLELFITQTMKLNQYIENSHVLAKTRELHHNQEIICRVEKCEKIVEKNPAERINGLLDFNVLNFIQQHPEHTHIFVCAGAWHTANLTTHLKAYGYHETPIKLHMARSTGMVINANNDQITPLAISKIIKENSMT